MNLKQSIESALFTLDLIPVTGYDSMNRLLGTMQLLREVAKEIPDNMLEIMTELEHLRVFKAQAEAAGFRAGYPAGNGAAAAAGPAEPSLQSGRSAGADEVRRAGRTVARPLDPEIVDQIENEEEKKA